MNVLSRILTLFQPLFFVLALAPRALADECTPSACEAASASCYECMTCAADGYCAPLYQGCVADQECLAFSACQDIGWGWEDPAAQYALCVAGYPHGALLFGALLDCLGCVSCRGCDPGMYDPNPGCGE